PFISRDARHHLSRDGGHLVHCFQRVQFTLVLYAERSKPHSVYYLLPIVFAHDRLASNFELPSKLSSAMSAPFHSITSSASASSVSGIWRPSALAVLMLTTSSILVGCTTGISAGFSPLRTRPT